MSNSIRATELTGTIDEQGNLHLDVPVSQVGPGRVRVIVLSADDADVDEGDLILRELGQLPTSLSQQV